MSTDNLHKYPGNLKQHKVEPFLSDSLYEKLCEARRYPGQMITHAWDARLQQWITAAMEQEAELQRLRGLLDEAREALDALMKGRVSGAYGTAWSEARETLAKLKK